MSEYYTHIEQAGYHAWPAFEQVRRQGWILRFAGGYTKRANSVTVLSDIPEFKAEQVTRCEKEYNLKKLPCIFRLLSFNDNSRIGAVLDSRGYTRLDRTFVLVRDLNNSVFPKSSLNRLAIEDWMECYCRLSEKDLKDHGTHIEIIQGIRDDILPVVLRQNNRDVSCGLGVIHNGYLGLFDIVTHPGHRRKGYGFDLINGMLSWGVKRGAHTAYLQVVADNKEAIGLYQKLGYTSAYEYHYRVQNDFPRQVEQGQE